MLIVERLRELTLRGHTHTPGQRYLSAASGLVCEHGRVYVMADDEHALAVFSDVLTPGFTVPLFEGVLPAGKKARKRSKPDTETLLLLPAAPAWPHGALLALGSGSQPKRCRAACVALDRRGLPLSPASVVDLAPLYEPLRQHFGDLNIEGAFISDGEFVLLQRGHRGGAPNASVHYALAPVLDWLHRTGPVPAPRHVRKHILGDVAGVPLAFTDGAALPGGRWVFTAVAEVSDDSVADGACVGSAVGVMSRQGELQALVKLPGCEKVEGIAARLNGRTLELCLVTDADDPRIASQLLRTRLRL